MEVQKTALYNIHKSLGAKFVPFAGYEMPIQYKDGIVKEHISTRTFAGFFDVSHMGQFFLEGDETLTEALEKIIPADLKSLKINHSKYSFLLNNDGGIIDDLIVTKTEKGFCIILNAACKENDIKQISQFLGSNHKQQLNNELSLIALQGPKSVEILEKLLPGVSNLKFMKKIFALEEPGMRINILDQGWILQIIFIHILLKKTIIGRSIFLSNQNY